jgi:hypothetical protein
MGDIIEALRKHSDADEVAYWGYRPPVLTLADVKEIVAIVDALRAAQQPDGWILPVQCDENGESGPYYYPQRERPFNDARLVPYFIGRPSPEPAKVAEGFDMRACHDFWCNYSSLNEGEQDELNTQRHEWLAAMLAASGEVGK